MTPARAAIFDLDGTLVDNMPFHARAWVAMADRLGVTCTAERFEREHAGKRNEEIFPELLGRPVPPDELTRLAETKESLYRELYGPHLAPLPGAVDLLARLGIASAAPAANRAFVLEGLGLLPRFACVVGAEHVARGKPHPDLFLAAAEALEVDPAACVVFEDAVHGVTAARAAGMTAVGVATVTPAARLAAAGAAWTLPDLRALPGPLERLLGLDAAG